MPYVGNIPAEKYASFEVQHFTTSATTSYTLTHAVANELDIRLVINNVIQQPGASYAYTAAGTTLTLASATTGGDTMYAVYIGKAVQTVNPGTDTVGTAQLVDNSVNEAKLKVSNSPTNGYVLSAQSAASGGLTWAVDAAGTVTGYTNGVDNRVITSSGTTTLNGEANLTFDGSQLTIPTGSSGAPSLAHAGDTDTGIYFSTNNVFFATAGAFRLKITSGGDMRSYGWVGNGTGDGWKLMNDDNQGTMNLETNKTTARTLFNFINGNGTVGTIATDGSATAFNTSSDYRLKENVNYDFDATTRLKQLKPARFNFKADADKTVDGFVAHEVSSVIPEAISGEKDAMHPEVLYVDEVLYTAEDELPEGMNIGDTKAPADELPEGKNFGDVKEETQPNYQGIDQSKLVPLLVKSLQEALARIEVLENA